MIIPKQMIKTSQYFSLGWSLFIEKILEKF